MSQPARVYKVRHADGTEELVVGDKVYFCGGLLEIELKGQKQAIFMPDRWVQVTPSLALTEPQFAMWEQSMQYTAAQRNQ